MSRNSSPVRTALTIFVGLGLLAVGATAATASTGTEVRTTDALDDVQLGPATLSYWSPLSPFVPDQGSRDQEDGCWSWDWAELNFYDFINNERQERKLGRVQIDPELSKVAAHHSYNMMKEQDLYHTPEDRLRERVTEWQILGENVGTGGDAWSIHRAFMDSPPHRDIILHDAMNYVGIGVSHQEDGRMWVTVLFEAYEDPGTTMDMSTGC